MGKNEPPDFVVCVLEGTAEASFRPTNAHGECHDCGRGIEFRPYILTDFPGIPRICVECAVARTIGGRA